MYKRQENGRAVVACDADATMCELTRSSAPDVATLKAALPELPFCSGSFDIVTANFVINHVEAPCASMRELSRVCRRDGIVAATIWPAGGAGFGPLLREVLSCPDLTPLPTSPYLPIRTSSEPAGASVPSSPRRGSTMSDPPTSAGRGR